MAAVLKSPSAERPPRDSGERWALGDPSRPGRVVLGKFALMRRLGSGAAAEVFEAENLLVGKRVALKLLRPELAERADLRHHFVAEARAAARIAHPNVVDIHDLGIAEDGTAFLVMELLEGESLQDVLSSRGKLSPSYACELMLQVLAGVGAAHRHGIVHRDLKPANVIVTHPRPEQPKVKVVDFGIALGIYSQALDTAQRGLVFGTPLYMAPEQALGEAVDARADIYSAAVMLYEMLSGEPPYAAPDVRSLMARVVRADWTPLSAKAPCLAESLVAVVERALSLDPTLRPSSAEQFAAELAPFAHMSPTSPSLSPAVSAAPIPLVRRGRTDSSSLRLDFEPPMPVGIALTNAASDHAQAPAAPSFYEWLTPSAAPWSAAPPPSSARTRAISLTEVELMNPRIPRPPSTPQLVEDALPIPRVPLGEVELLERRASTEVPLSHVTPPKPRLALGWVIASGASLGAAVGWLLSLI